MASKGAPDNSGRSCVAEGGSLGPVTCENPQPALSKTAPFSSICVMPLPCSGSPGGLCHASDTKRPPSNLAMRDVMLL